MYLEASRPVRAMEECNVKASQLWFIDTAAEHHKASSLTFDDVVRAVAAGQDSAAPAEAWRIAAGKPRRLVLSLSYNA
jgi:hypothetical protein